MKTQKSMSNGHILFTLLMWLFHKVHIHTCTILAATKYISLPLNSTKNILRAIFGNYVILFIFLSFMNSARVQLATNISDERRPKMGKWRDSNFKSNQALLVSYHPVKIQVD